MRRRRRMPHIKNVRRPREVSRVLRTADDEAPPRAAPCGLDEELFQPALTVRGIRAQVRQVRARHRRSIDVAMDLGIDAPVQRRDAPSAEVLAKFVKSASARVTENEIEVAETGRGEIRNRFAGFQPRERHAGIEIVEDAKPGR